MFNNVLRTALFAAAVTLLSQTGAAQAEEKVWMHAGRIDTIDHVHQRMVVNDLSMKLTGSSQLFSVERKPIAASDLAVGAIVGIDYERLPGIGRVLVELQIYGPGSKPRLDSDGE